MNLKEHRVYQYMSEPVRMMGCTLDEIGLFVVNFFLFLVAEQIFYKMIFLLIGTLGVFLIKRFKKMATGFSLKSFLHWSLRLRFGLPSAWPESWKRYWLP